MISKTLKFQLTRDHIATYQFAVRDHVRKIAQPNKSTRIFVGLLGGAAVGIVLIILDTLIASLTGQESNPVGILTGLVCGVVLVLSLSWKNYFDFRKHIARPGGPALAPHEVDVRADGLKTRSPFLTAEYRWAAFSDVTIARDLIILWLEPSSGLAIVRSAFENDAEEQAFLETARAAIGDKSR